MDKEIWEEKMTNETILKKAIEKVVKNGWPKREADSFWGVWNRFGQRMRDEALTPALIFSHDFAKAFFGKKKLESWEVDDDAVGRYDKGCHECGTGKMMKVPIWQYHLQQMVLDKDPIKYLEKFL